MWDSGTGPNGKAIELEGKVALALSPTLWSMLAAEEGNQQFPCQLVWDLVPGCGQAFQLNAFGGCMQWVVVWPMQG